MTSRDDEHWLWRLEPNAWLDAADHELAAAHAHRNTRRTAITHARRAAGMALNAVLVASARTGEKHARERAESVWGRSYVDHLRCLANADERDRAPLDIAACQHARELMRISVMPPQFVELRSPSRSDVSVAVEHARDLVARCRAWVEQTPDM